MLQEYEKLKVFKIKRDGRKAAKKPELDVSGISKKTCLRLSLSTFVGVCFSQLHI